MISYDKVKVKEKLTLEDNFELLNEFGGNPIYTPFGIVSQTICHHKAGEGSHKLYYYKNSGLYRCYTGGCEEPTFDTFQLVSKIMKNNFDKDFDLNASVRWVAQKFNIEGEAFVEEEKDESQEIFDEYDRISKISINDNKKEIVLKEYDKTILDRFNYDIVLQPWIDDNISQDSISYNKIGYYPGKMQITIPHYDINNRFIGLRGRSLAQEDIDRYGKYRPMYVNKTLYNHPLGMNLYNLNNSKDNINVFGKAIIFESEKACLRYQTEFGIENDISVACCGSSVSSFQIDLLTQSGAREIIIAFDRDFEDIGDLRFRQIKNNYIKLNDKYKNNVTLSFIFDKNKITKIKSSPIDEDKGKFLQLYKERLFL